jgi:hypothetical protein
MAGDCRRVLDQRFVALIASSPTSSVAFGDRIDAADLEAFGTLTEAWHRDGLATPLLLTPGEFRRSLDAFPLEYQAIVDRHVLIAGAAPFQDLVVDPQHLRRACEAQAKSHLIHLRQGWMEAVGHDDQLAALIAGSATPLHALLANLARLCEGGLQGAAADRDWARLGARLAGLDEALIADVLTLEQDPDKARHLVRRLPDYLKASEQLWAFVDGWTR